MTTKKGRAKKSPEVKKPVTRVAIVLDRSGSMSVIRDATIQMFNKQVESLQEAAKTQDLRVSLVTFSGTVDEPVLWNESIEKVRMLTREDYNPGGGTAMYDGVGTTIQKLRNLKEADDAETAFLLIVISDGEENQSRLYDSYRVADLIKTVQGTERWTISYVGANQDLSKVAQTLNIPLGNTMAFVASTAGMNQASFANSCSTTGYLSARSAGNMQATNFYGHDGGGGQQTGLTQHGQTLEDILKGNKQ